MPSNKVCCYTIDENYLLPTLLSAIQVRKATEASDVIVFCFGEPTAKSEAFLTIFAQYGVKFRYTERSAIDGLPILFARFFLARLLADDCYESVVYLDGDTQILGSVQPLLDADVPSGCFLAALDPMAIIVRERAHTRNKAYLASIGIGPGKLGSYRNSGVLRFNLRDWEEIGRAVIAASARGGHSYRFADQDPLNLCCSERCLTMSYRWNFPSFFLGLDFAPRIEPTILHFMSQPRPWDGAFAPWGRAYHQPYRDLAREHGKLAAWVPPGDTFKTVRYHLQQHVKRVIEQPAWRHASVGRQIAEAERNCFV